MRAHVHRHGAWSARSARSARDLSRGRAAERFVLRPEAREGESENQSRSPW